jgi:thiol-disulfide isomerase/thioredoxin
MPRLLGIVAAVVALAAVVFTFKFYLAQPGGPAGGALGGGPAVLAGAPAASYPVKDLAGKDDGLDRYRGHVVLVNLWASWCAPCRSETPALEQLYERDRAKGLVVLGINQGESTRAAAAFASEMKISNTDGPTRRSGFRRRSSSIAAVASSGASTASSPSPK